MDVQSLSTRQIFEALAYVFKRVGQCIKSGGRRMERLALLERAIPHPPANRKAYPLGRDWKGEFEALTSLGVPGKNKNGEVVFVTERKKVKGKILNVPVQSSRKDRRPAAIQAAKRARKARRAARSGRTSPA